MFDRMITYLAIVECTFDCNVVDIGIRHCCHLCLLDRRNTTFGVKNKDGNIGFVAEAVNRSTFLSIMNIIQKSVKIVNLHTSLCRHLWHQQQSTFPTSLLGFSVHSSGVKRTRINSQVAGVPRL